MKEGEEWRGGVRTREGGGGGQGRWRRGVKEGEEWRESWVMHTERGVKNFNYSLNCVHILHSRDVS